MLLKALEYSSNLRIMITKNRQRTLGAALKFNSGFLESLQDVLNKRTQKALQLISAQSAFQKAAPQKQEKVVILSQLTFLQQHMFVAWSFGYDVKQYPLFH